ncbi:hypothetical protein EV127DRAFT_337745, partial [Xylaria flabelliformis]
MEAIVNEIIAWCRQGTSQEISDWYKKLKEEREIATSTRSFFLRVDESFTSRIFNAMPLQAQKILGKKDFDAVDLLNLPRFDDTINHWIVYLDLPARVDLESVEWVDFGRTGRQYRQFKKGADETRCSEMRCYVGSSVNKNGGQVRIRQHQSESGKSPENAKHHSQHYDFIRQKDVVTNFRVAALFDKASEDDSAATQPVQVLEGLLMTYLGLY